MNPRTVPPRRDSSSQFVSIFKFAGRYIFFVQGYIKLTLNFRARPLCVTQEPDELGIRLWIKTFPPGRSLFFFWSVFGQPLIPSSNRPLELSLQPPGFVPVPKSLFGYQDPRPMLSCRPNISKIMVFESFLYIFSMTDVDTIPHIISYGVHKKHHAVSLRGGASKVMHWRSGSILYLFLQPVVLRKSWLLRQSVHFLSQFPCQLPSLNIFKPLNLHLSSTVNREPLNREPG